MGDLHKAAREGNLAELTRLLTAGQDVNVRDKLSRTPLHLAAWAGQVMVHLHWLMTCCCCICSSTHAHRAQAECLTTLLASDANHGAAAQDDMNALHFAAQKGHVSACKVLLDKGGLPSPRPL